MYKGRRDPEVRLVVRMLACSKYTDKGGRDWVEIVIPPESWAEYKNPWGSIMVKPEQVCWLDAELNTVDLNDDAAIVCSVKLPDSHVVASQETLTPFELAGRIIKHEHAIRFHPPLNEYPSIAFAKDWKASGLTMDAYLNRIPRRLDV